MNIADTIARLDAELGVNYREQRLVHQTMYYYDQYGNRVLTAAGKRRMKVLGEERRHLEESANAAYRI